MVQSEGEAGRYGILDNELITVSRITCSEPCRACVELRSGALAALAGQIETTAEMRAAARRSMARLEETVARAWACGRLRADVTALDITWLIEQFSRRPPDPVDPDEERNIRSRLVAIALDGLRAPGTGALPGRPPGRHRYVHRWSPAPR